MHRSLYSIYFLAISFFIYNSALSTLPNGITYSQYTDSEKDLLVHKVTIDPTLMDIELIHAIGLATDRESVLAIATRTSSCHREVLAAINGGFFRRGGRFNGLPLGILKIGQDFYSEPFLQRGILAWTNYQNSIDSYLGPAQSHASCRFHDKTIPVTRINQPRTHKNDSIIYTPIFHPTTLTDNSGIELVISQGRIQEINYSGNSRIPRDGFVLSLGESYRERLYQWHPRYDDPVIFEYQIQEPGQVQVSTSSCHSYDHHMFMVSATPLLITNGITRTAQEMRDELQQGITLPQGADEISANFHNPEQASWLIEQKHPRTAVGITRDGQWLFVVVDGRQPGISQGMTLPELALFMEQQGCVAALNLGGGGDSTLVIEGKISNKPSGSSTPGAAGYNEQSARPVSDALCVVKKQFN